MKLTLNYDPGFEFAGRASINFAERRYEGQFLSAGEPTVVKDAETGEWVTTYPLVWCPGPPITAMTFGGKSAFVPFVQEIA